MTAGHLLTPRRILLVFGSSVLLFGVTAAAIIIVRIADRLSYDPVAVMYLAPVPGPESRHLKLYDGLTINQTLTMTGRTVSHVGVGVANFRDAPSDSVLTVRLFSDDNTLRYTGHTRVSALRNDGLTYLPAPLTLSPNASYTLELTTSGVFPSHSLAVFWEPAAEILTNERLVATTVKPGNIAIALERRPTPRVLFSEFLSSTGAHVIGLYFSLCITLLAIPSLRRYFKKVLSAPLDLGVRPIPWRELLFAGALATILATAVTLPYYTNLDRISTMGDVQRALVYRGLARDALLTQSQLGLWDPYLCGGEPLLANMESANLGPWFLLILLAGENLDTRLSVTATLIAGFLGAYVLARTVLHTSRLGALLAGLIFSFSGFQMLAFANGNYAWLPVGFIPWLLYAYFRSLENTGYLAIAALIGAFIFLEGSIHMLVYAGLTLMIVGFTLAALKRSWRPIYILLLVGSLVASLTAIKLLPVASIQAVAGSFDRPPPFIQPWSWIGTMFIDRNQLTIGQWLYKETGEYFRWTEYGSYVGILPVVLFLAALPRLYRRPLGVTFIVGSLLLLLMTFAAFPWTLLHQLPLLDSVLRNPQRLRVVLVLLGGAIAGYGLTVLTRRHLWQAALVTLIIIDLATFHSELYHGLFRFDRPSINPTLQFTRVTESYSDPGEGGRYKVAYENYRANQGTTDMCMPYLMGRGVHANGVDSSNPAQPYRGEAYLTRGGTAGLTQLLPNQIEVALHTTEPAWLVLNQNYFPGWRTYPPREIVNYQGLVAARVDVTDRKLHFQYSPRSYHIGAVISALALITIGGIGTNIGYRRSS